MSWGEAGVPLAERLAAKLVRQGDCWVWTGVRTYRGDYGVIRNEQGRKEGIHRVAFRLHYGYSPRVVRHSCDNGLCANPEHLLGGTQTDNVRDMMERKRHAAHKDPVAWHAALCARERALDTYPSGEDHHIHRRQVVRNAQGRFA